MDFHEEPAAVPLVRLNHVSFQCASVEASVRFYQRALGFELVRRPASLDFEGAWLHKYGMGIHLLQRGSVHASSGRPQAGASGPAAPINPRGNHISFQFADMGLMKTRLRDMELDFVAAGVRDGETVVEQLFFHDPDGNLIEICDCEKLPVVPFAPDDAAAAACHHKPLVQMNVHD